MARDWFGRICVVLLPQLGVASVHSLTSAKKESTNFEGHQEQEDEQEKEKKLGRRGR